MINKKSILSGLFLVSFSMLLAMEAPRLSPRAAAEELLKRAYAAQDLQLGSYSTKDLLDINTYLRKKTDDASIALYWEIDEEINKRPQQPQVIQKPLQEEVDRDLQEIVREMLEKIAGNREINFEDFDNNRLEQVREYVRKNKHLKGADNLNFQITYYLNPADIESRANDLIKKQLTRTNLNLDQFSDEDLQILSQYLKLRIDRGEKGPIKGVYTLINSYLAGMPVILIPQPTPRPIKPTPQPIRPAPLPIQPVPQPPYQPVVQLPRPQAKAPYDEGMIQFWQEWFDKGQLNLPDKPIDSLLNALAGIEIHNLQTKHMDLYNMLKTEFARRSGAQPIIPIPRPTPPIRPPAYEEEVEEKVPARGRVHLIDTRRLNQLGLCPLFQGLDRETQAAYGLQSVADQCTKNIANNQTLMQLNTINQFALEGIGYATCPVQSLRSISLLMQYIQTGDQKFLRDLNDERNARQFVEGLTRKGFSTEWLTKEWLEDVVKKANIPGVNQDQITVLDNVLEVDPQYEGIFVVEENIAKMRRVKQIVRDGLKKGNFVHAFVIGTSDQAQLGGGEARIHFFAFAVIKQGNIIQYIVVDTAPAAYHLGGYNLKRLEYLIQLLTKGSTTINLQQEAQKQ